jgi:predicted PurR-regulated permease PerM
VTDPSDDGRVTQPTRTVRVELDVTSIWRFIGAVLATLVILFAVRATRSLLAMLAISFFLSLAMEPAIRMLTTRRRWRRGTAVGVIFGLTVMLLLLFAFVLVPAIVLVAETIAANSAEWVAQVDEILAGTLDQAAVSAGVSDAGDQIAAWADDPFGRVLGLATSTVALLFDLSTIALFTFYLSADSPRIRQAVLRRFSPRAQQRIDWTWDQAIVETGGYFYSRMVLMGINGLGFFTAMVVVGLPIELAIGLALFAGFVSEFIPSVGTYIGAAVPIVVALAVEGLVAALVILGYALVYQQIENYWLSPKISSDAMTLNGGVAFGAALAGGAIAGPMGAFFALPIAALVTSWMANYARSYDVAQVPDGVELAPGPGAS